MKYFAALVLAGFTSGGAATAWAHEYCLHGVCLGDGVAKLKRLRGRPSTDRVSDSALSQATTPRDSRYVGDPDAAAKLDRMGIHGDARTLLLLERIKGACRYEPPFALVRRVAPYVVVIMEPVPSEDRVRQRFEVRHISATYKVDFKEKAARLAHACKMAAARFPPNDPHEFERCTTRRGNRYASGKDVTVSVADQDLGDWKGFTIRLQRTDSWYQYFFNQQDPELHKLPECAKPK